MTDKIELIGGSLSVEQLNAIFETIPQEMDVLDENDVVVWSSMNKHRLFKRTEKDIGKTVFEVHPGHSQGHVKAVLKQMHEAFYSLHNDQGKYLGCIEVTQPVADLQEKGSKWRNVWNMIFKKK